MNYIRHLHAFYHYIKKDGRLSSTHVSLYMALFQYWNYNRFQNPFRIDREELMQLSKIGSKNTYHKCIKELHSYQYIIYHSGISKYQHVKVSMIRLETKKEEPGLKQLDLFNPPVGDGNSEKNAHSGEGENFSENGADFNGPVQVAVSDKTAPELTSFNKNSTVVLDGSASTKTDTHKRTKIEPPSCTEIDTHQCTKSDTLSCTEIGTVCVPILTATCPKNGTVCVPLLGHNIKRKQINIIKQCVCKTEKHTQKIIFKKNKKLENAVTNLADIINQKKEQNQDGPPPKNLQHPAIEIQAPPSAPTGLNLLLVEEYFRGQNFPIPEAQKFFYYNQGRGWMLTSTLPIQDWQAFAQKWMLNNAAQKIIQNAKPGSERKAHGDTSSGKDYSEPL